MQRLLSYDQRLSMLEADKRDLDQDMAEVYRDAKGAGFDVKVLRQVRGDLRRERNRGNAERDVYDLYRLAIDQDDSGETEERDPMIGDSCARANPQGLSVTIGPRSQETPESGLDGRRDGEGAAAALPADPLPASPLRREGA